MAPIRALWIVSNIFGVNAEFAQRSIVRNGDNLHLHSIGYHVSARRDRMIHVSKVSDADNLPSGVAEPINFGSHCPAFAPAAVRSLRHGLVLLILHDP